MRKKSEFMIKKKSEFMNKKNWSLWIKKIGVYLCSKNDQELQSIEYLGIFEVL